MNQLVVLLYGQPNLAILGFLCEVMLLCIAIEHFGRHLDDRRGRRGPVARRDERARR